MNHVAGRYVKRVGVYFGLLFAIQSLCCGDVTNLSAEDRKALQYSERFHEIHLTSDLPLAVVSVCAGENAKLANPGEKWNATDVITDSNLPAKRLIWAAVDGQYYIVHYERGGIAHTYHIVVAKLDKEHAKPKVVWRATGGPFKDYAAFLGALRSGKLDDRQD